MKSSSPRWKAEDLAADGRAGFEIVNDFKLVGWPGQGGERRAIRRRPAGLADDQRADQFVLLDNAGFLNGFDEWPAAAVAAGEFADRCRRLL